VVHCVNFERLNKQFWLLDTYQGLVNPITVARTARRRLRPVMAHVIAVAAKGYGNALRAGIEAARGRFVIMGDSDDSYDFLTLQPFLEKLRDGYDLVLGNRFRGGIAPGAMPHCTDFLATRS
jgi:glycosyltransferase involved in cell wall biosynthesis